jgi:hypothetical protein
MFLVDSGFPGFRIQSRRTRMAGRKRRSGNVSIPLTPSCYGAIRKYCLAPTGVCRNGLAASMTSAHGPVTSPAD